MIWVDVDAAVVVPVNILPLIDDTDFVSIEEAIAYDESGMDLNWNFVTPAGAVSQTNLTPTTAGSHDWAHEGNGMYSIELTASGGTVDNDTEGFGWFSGVCDGVLPWRGPIIGFRAAGLNGLLIEDAFSATRGLAGTALPAAAADAAGGLAISDAGGLDLDAILSRLGTPSDLGSGATIAANLVDIEAQTDDIGAAGAGLTAVPWNSAWDAEVQSEVLDALNSDNLTEAYAADGAEGSVAEILYMLLAVLTEFAVSSTTMTVKKLDGSTTAATFTLDDADDPASITRAS